MQRSKPNGRKSWWVLCLALLAGVWATTASPARADSTAAQFLKPYVDWAKSDPEQRKLRVVMISNHISQQATYAEGVLDFYSSAQDYFNRDTGFQSTEVELLYNDRKWDSDQSRFGSDPQPFSPHQTDKIEMRLDAIGGRLHLKLPSGVQRIVDLQAAQGMLVGAMSSSSPLGRPMVVLSVSQRIVPEVR